MRFTKLFAAMMLIIAIFCVIATADTTSFAATASTASPSVSVPRYNHIFVVVEENHDYGQILGNPAAPTINQLAHTYGLATQYTGVGDPSAPNYVALIGGSTFGIKDDNPYYTHTVDQRSLIDQLEGNGLSWKGYFQSLPYPGYTGICYPTRCNGTPDIDPLYASKHNGIIYYSHVQSSLHELQKMVPETQLDQDLQHNQVPNFSFIVPDQCHDMHGSPPYCVDSGPPKSTNDNILVRTGDSYLSKLTGEIMGASLWSQGNNAIVITWDEGNTQQSRVVTLVITNHGPHGLRDGTSYNHYSLLLTIEQAFGLGCIQHSCDKNIKPMAPLFAE